MNSVQGRRLQLETLRAPIVQLVAIPTLRALPHARHVQEASMLPMLQCNAMDVLLGPILVPQLHPAATAQQVSLQRRSQSRAQNVDLVQ